MPKKIDMRQDLDIENGDDFTLIQVAIQIRKARGLNHNAKFADDITWNRQLMDASRLIAHLIVGDFTDEQTKLLLTLVDSIEPEEIEASIDYGEEQ